MILLDTRPKQEVCIFWHVHASSYLCVYVTLVFLWLLIAMHEACKQTDKHENSKQLTMRNMQVYLGRYYDFSIDEE